MYPLLLLCLCKWALIENRKCLRYADCSCMHLWFSSTQFIFSFHRSALNLENVAEYHQLTLSLHFSCSFDSSAFPFVIISERLVQDFVMLYVHLFRWKHNNYNLRNCCNSPKQWQLKPVVFNNNRTHIIVSMCKTNIHTRRNNNNDF